MNFQNPTPPRVLMIFTNSILQSLHIRSGYKTTQPFFGFLASFIINKFTKKNEFSNPEKPIFCELGHFYKFLRTKIKKWAVLFCNHQIYEEIAKDRLQKS